MRIYAFEYGKHVPGVMVIVAQSEKAARAIFRDESGSPEEPVLVNTGMALHISVRGREADLHVQDVCP